jgi:hypothetical protein
MFIVGPILGMLFLGAWLTLRSGVASMTSRAGVRVAAENLSQAILMVGACLVGLAVLQHVIGYRGGYLW